jgi:glycosyl hydrolase family 10
MGTMLFQVPPGLPADASAELERASIAGGQDCMPYPSQVLLDDGQLIVHRRVEESGCLQAPWNVCGAGRLMTSSATLMERLTPYHLAIELARGKINQLRGQTADWLMGGLVLNEPVADRIRQATQLFGQAVSRLPSAEAHQHADQALAHGFAAAEMLVQSYIEQVFHVRHMRQPKLDTWLACSLLQTPTGELAKTFLDTFNAVQVPFPWNVTHSVEDHPDWQSADALVDWAVQNNLHLLGGPLIDFSGRDLPDWLWEKERDLLSLSNYLTEYVACVVRRYQTRIRTWQVSAASNWSGVLAMGDEELLWLTVRIIDAIKKIDPALEVIVGVAQPWGDYLTQQERSQSPFVFADTLLRTGVKIAGLELELLMGVTPRGSYCRDTLDASRLFDLYALLGVPLQVMLSYPSSAEPDPQADPDQRAQAGFWRSGFTPQVQADWLAAFAELALCKPYVRTVRAPHFSDAEPHTYPHCGLVDAAGPAKPGIAALQRLRGIHLK